MAWGSILELVFVFSFVEFVQFPASGSARWRPCARSALDNKNFLKSEMLSNILLPSSPFARIARQWFPTPPSQKQPSS
jgi:hypothetical protein